jgi:hypothetical protein
MHANIGRFWVVVGWQLLGLTTTFWGTSQVTTLFILDKIHFYTVLQLSCNSGGASGEFGLTIWGRDLLQFEQFFMASLSSLKCCFQFSFLINVGDLCTSSPT